MNKMMTMIKKVTATILAAATVMTATVAATPAIVRADDTPVITEETLSKLSQHPTSDMNVELIRRAYKQGGQINSTNIASGSVVYVQSSGGKKITAVYGDDIVVVLKVYRESGFLGIGSSYVMSCKSLVTGDDWELTLDDTVRVSELNKISNVNDGGVLSALGLYNNFSGPCRLGKYLANKMGGILDIIKAIK